MARRALSSWVPHLAGWVWLVIVLPLAIGICANLLTPVLREWWASRHQAIRARLARTWLGGVWTRRRALVVLLLLMFGAPSAATPAGRPPRGQALPGRPAPRKMCDRIVYTKSIGTLPDDANTDLYSIRPDGTGEVRLTTVKALDQNPAFSPDCAVIAFNSDREGIPGALYLMNADGTDQHRLTNAPFWAYGPSWSPDGQYLAYGNSNGLYKVRADGRGPAEQLTPTGFGPSNDPEWSPDGRSVLFTAYNVLYLVDAGGGRPRRVWQPAEGLQGDIQSPSWSPDGKEIALSAPGGFSSDIIVIDLDGVPQRTLAGQYEVQYCGSVDWSADPGQLVLACGETGLTLVAADGRGVPRSLHTRAYDVEW